MNERDWARLFSAVSSVRTLLSHHPEVFQEERTKEVPGLLGVVVGLMASAVPHRRSVVQTNGLRCLADTFRCGCMRCRVYVIVGVATWNRMV